DLLGGDVMGEGGSGDLRQVGDAEDLAVFGDLLHFLSDDIGRFAADIGVHFVKNQHRHLVLSGEDGFESADHPSRVGGGGDGAQRAGRFTGIRRELEFDGVEAGGGDA